MFSGWTSEEPSCVFSLMPAQHCHDIGLARGVTAPKNYKCIRKQPCHVLETRDGLAV